MYTLEIVDSGGAIETHVLSAGLHRLGKAADCEIPLNDTFASRYHAELAVKSDAIELKDTGSRNGVWTENGRVDVAHLLLGEPFKIGDLSLRVTEARAEQDMPPAAPIEDEEHPAAAPDSDISEIKRIVHKGVLEYLDRHKRGVLHTLSTEELRNEARNAAQEVIQALSVELPEALPEDELVAAIVAEAVGLGPIEPFLADESVTEIMVNGPKQVYVERGGRLTAVNSPFSSTQSLLSIIERIVTPLGRRIDEGSPMVDARLEDGSRVNAIIPPLAISGPTLTIRKFANHRFGIEDLVRIGSLNQDMADFLEVCVRHRKNIVVSGGTGTGKTTTLNILSNFIPAVERIVTIEDAAELQLKQDHVVSLESRPANVEGKGSVAIRDLVKNALRMRPDRIVVGECRGAEALDMLQAMNTGHDGSLTTAHANSPRDILSRLEVMVLLSGVDLPMRAVREQLASAVDIILQITRFSDGKRRITSIVEVDGMEGEVILLQKIFQFKQTGRSKDGDVLGEFEGCGYAPSFYRELEDLGEALPRDLFGRRSDDPPKRVAHAHEGGHHVQ